MIDKERKAACVIEMTFFFLVRPPPPTILVEFFPHKTYMLQIDFYCATNFPNKSKPVVPQESRPYCNNGFYWLRQVLLCSVYILSGHFTCEVFLLYYVCVYMSVYVSAHALFIFLQYPAITKRTAATPKSDIYFYMYKNGNHKKI